MLCSGWAEESDPQRRVVGSCQASERLPTWMQRPRTWVFECKLCRARVTYLSYCWPCCATTPPHDTFHEETARRIYCIGSRKPRTGAWTDSHMNGPRGSSS